MSQPESDQKNLADILTRCHMSDAHDNWVEGWETSSASYRETGLHFIEREYVDEQCGLLGMTDEMRSQVLEGCALFERHPALKLLLWHCHSTAFRQAAPLRPDAFKQWSAIPDSLDPAAGMFFVYLFLSGVPYTLALHRQHRIAQGVSVDTMRDLLVWIDDHRQKTGKWGLDYAQVSWLGLHFTGYLFQLGRLQFDRNRYYYEFLAFRRHSDGHVVFLAADGHRFRKDGQFDGINDVTDPDAWTATFRKSDTLISGYPIHPEGYVLKEPVELSADEWHQVLMPDATTVGVHIPGTGPMDFDACRASFEQAIPFWRTHFPEHRVHAFVCTSWLLDPQFEQRLNPDSNIVRFLREWYLLPLPKTNGRETLRRVFGIREADSDTLSTLPQDTSLRRAVVSHIQQGGYWRGQGSVMLPQNMSWGNQVYRRGWKDRMKAEG